MLVLDHWVVLSIEELLSFALFLVFPLSFGATAA